MSGLARVDVEPADSASVFRLSGEIDMSNADELFAAIGSSVPIGTSRLVVDLSPTTYIDSAGVRLLFRLASRAVARRQELLIVVPEASPIRAVLELMGLPMVSSAGD
jgi:anti-anti-sigma factor